MRARSVRRIFALAALMGAAFLGQPSAAFAYDCAATFLCVSDGSCIDATNYKITNLQIHSEGNGNGAITGNVDSVFSDDIYDCSFWGDPPPEGTYIVDPATGLMQSSIVTYDESANAVVVGTGTYYDPSTGYAQVPAPAPSPSVTPPLSAGLPGLAETGTALTSGENSSQPEGNRDGNPEAKQADPSSTASDKEPNPRPDAPEETRKILDGLAG